MNALVDKLMELSEEKLAQIYKNVFSTPEGQLLLEDLKQRSFFYSPIPLGEPGQRAEGARSVVLHIETQINYEKGDSINEEAET